MIPLGVGLVGKNGRDLPLTLANGAVIERGVLVLNEPTASFEFTGIGEKPVLSINRGFSAPIKLNTDLDGGDLALLAAHDNDAFNRWQALQTTAMRLLIDNVAALQAGQPPRQRRQPDRGARRHPRRCQCWNRPSSRSRWCRRATATWRARSAATSIRTPSSARAARLRARAASELGDALVKTYERMTVPGPYSPDAASAGRRSLAQCRARPAGGNRRAEAIARAAAAI